MACLKSNLLSLVTLTFLVVGQPTLTGALKGDLKNFELYPGIGYFQPVAAPWNWTEVYHYCIDQFGAHLAVPNSKAEADAYEAIIATIDPQFQNFVYIGFHDFFVNGDYETVHDTPLEKSGYTRWALGAPDVSPTLRCGGFSKDGGLLNLDCGAQIDSMFICELPLWADYDLVPGLGHYKYHTDAKTWPEAWKTCRQEDSHLAVINSDEEYDVLQEYFIKHPDVPGADYRGAYAWVGVHTKFGYNRFRTVDGTSLEESGFATWAPDNPDYGLALSFTEVALGNQNGSLAIIDPTFKLGYFCEHEL